MGFGTAAMAVETPIGTIGVEATDDGVRRVRLPGDRVLASELETEERAAAANAAAAAEQLAEYAGGVRERFELELDWTGVDETYRRVLETLREIAPFGRTVTYGELGRRAGVDDPREIGVVAADGLGGFGGGLELKRRLLELEGVLPPRLDLGDG
jgi:methylated-DNA-[protein]-cysteine S-methyltransferase